LLATEKTTVGASDRDHAQAPAVRLVRAFGRIPNTLTPPAVSENHVERLPTHNSGKEEAWYVCAWLCSGWPRDVGIYGCWLAALGLQGLP
jgi:hypothetical protein